jgi:hypothetical protein
VDAYLALLLEVDAKLEDMMSGFNMDAMNVLMKYEGFSDLQDRFKEHLKAGENDKAESLLRSELEMEDGEIEAVIGHFQWILRTEEMEQQFHDEDDSNDATS